MLETLLKPEDREERCGLLLTDGTTVELKNIAENPETSFEMDPQEVAPYLVKETVAGTWHTHPGADPALSGADYECFAAWPELDHYIIGIREKDILVLKYVVDRGLVLVCD